ncbi:RagB/SusD family nutrient uptake outer membrane protein [Mucilaginibacter sp. BJC16-A38]|uniref:RagB/SusD family nutrient uptake outer membrane protein n=1 Tax=Mucilaginibacter phenanthrenivorans TaxID=1234842 RepID=UPI0021571CF4|nr:RagB/SusD family nutrient uptake outer membrane protein [Mucilaginibacter phenanthrenivorans]MCR8557768.1 RagB/SusD family nutrient uptake outer membrane protein [Mucilaginibacter phenanthrenivorans]
MKFIKKLSCCLVLFGLLFSACKKDFLVVNPTDRLTNASITTDTSLFESYVINRYLGEQVGQNEGEGSPPGFGRGFEYAMASSVTDESMYNTDNGSWLIEQGQMAANNTGFLGTLWARSYGGIRDCNYALSVIKSINMSAAHKTRLIGELEFIRAYRYQDLIRNYGKIVLVGDQVTQLTDNMQNPALFAQVSIQASIAYATAQLDDAAAKLPLNNSSTWALGRATKGAALALKSRLLLYAASPLYAAGTWADAAAAAKVVMDMGKYTLSQNGYSQLFLSPNDNEIIFERLFVPNVAPHVRMEISNGPNGYDGWAGNTPFQNLVDDYEMDNGKAITDPASGYDPQNPYVKRDPRFYATILYNGAPYRGSTVQVFLPGGKDSNQGPSNWNASQTGYYLKKFMNDSYPIDNPWSVAGGQPWIYMRYAEILLNYAEAQNEAAGPDGTVYAAVNSIRARASVNMPPLPGGLSKDDMRTAIQNERRIELAFEEHRFYDVRRWKIAMQTENVPAYGISVTVNPANPSGYTYTRKVSLANRSFLPQHYWLPIPLAEIQASGGQLKQNTGYN